MRRALALLCLALVGLSGCNVIPGQVRLKAIQTQATVDPDAKFHEIDLEVENAGANTARDVTIRDSLPQGFTYASTIAIDTSDAIRTRTQDPTVGTPSPVWGAWSLPPAVGGNATKLVVRFYAAVGRAPSKRANFVEVTSSDTDPVAAHPMALTAQATPLLDLAVGTRSPLHPGDAAVYSIRVRNTGSAAAGGVFVSAVLPSGFVYTATEGISGTSLRSISGDTDPLPDSILPAWGTWKVPPAQFDGTPGTLTIDFTARVASDVVPGVYTLSLTVTYGQLDQSGAVVNQQTQTVDGLAAVTVIR